MNIINLFKLQVYETHSYNQGPVINHNRQYMMVMKKSVKYLNFK